MDKISLVKKCTDDFKNIFSRDKIREHKELDWGDNGIGNRWCDKKLNYIAINRYRNPIMYTDGDEDIKDYIDIINKFTTEYNGTDKGIIGILILSIRTTKESRPIRKDIKDHYKNKSCVLCGSTSEIVVDHKNDYYDDMRVLDSKSQTLDDFQSLCNHCNLLKRQNTKKEKETGVIYSAKNIMQLKCFENEIILLEKLLPERCYSYFYDPSKYMKRLKYITLNNFTERVMKNKLINL
jgi:5-methylcytosine-specific restriction endonuclease McrA